MMENHAVVSRVLGPGIEGEHLFNAPDALGNQHHRTGCDLGGEIASETFEVHRVRLDGHNLARAAAQRDIGEYSHMRAAIEDNVSFLDVIAPVDFRHPLMVGKQVRQEVLSILVSPSLLYPEC